jgi:tetratricopeptide (TPR) repeat protein
MLNVIMFAESLRFYDVRYHDGGTMQQEAIEVYQIAIELALTQHTAKIEAGEETSRSLNGVVDLNEEISLDFSAKSIDGVLCALYTALGKVYFMANMFENAVEQYTLCIDLAPTYLDAIASRGSAWIILGKYKEAATDFSYVIEHDSKRRFLDTFTGLARVLQTKEQVSPRGWDSMIEQMQSIILQLESQVGQGQQSQEVRALLASSLARLYHVLFLYHDSKTKDTSAAWDSLTKAYGYKMSVLPPWNSELERQKIQATTQIFHKGFWPAMGSKTNVPIFIIGFVRSGSTLLERILDAHPDIAGTGENSVFNGNLDEIRNNIVKASTLGDPQALHAEVERSAEGVVTEIRRRWSMVASAEGRTNSSTSDSREPKRFVDKMLTNY